MYIIMITDKVIEEEEIPIPEDFLEKYNNEIVPEKEKFNEEIIPEEFVITHTHIILDTEEIPEEFYIDEHELIHAKYLIVDDSDIVRKMHKRKLNKPNIYIEESDNGLNAIKIILNHDDINYFDIIFIDNNMPIITGVLCCLILRLLNYNNIIIGITGEKNTNEFYKNGVDYVFFKPIQTEDLNSIILFVNLHKKIKNKKIIKIDGKYIWK